MFVALRDLRFARGRFILIGSVVALITVLVGFLSGLTGGLATQNVSAVLSLPADRIVFSAPADGSSASFADSAVTADQADAWSAAPGASDVQPLGISQTRAEFGDVRAAVALFGAAPGFDANSPTGDGLVGVSSPAASELGVGIGDEIAIAGMSFTVESIGGDDWYSHTPVIRLTLADWQGYAAATGSPDAFATVLAVSGDPDAAPVEAATATVSESVPMSLMALSAFRSEIGSLLLMVAMLFGISGLVIGAFFTVWTMQRAADVAVLKALGASTRSLVGDALGQALIVLAAGIGLGLAIVVSLGLAVGGALPFLLSPLTTLVPGALMIVLGLGGAAFAIRSITSADPLTALGSNR
ncbi:ABC transporter permease [Agromyces atrinae]|uniref:ABC transporter permease n=1 Tax=Agromyces atrinae TaxID=592376 RepID=A0A4Q2MD44_9MICO|nr:ABC transporter permease [Agromyces atrinae]NYD67761.1 putative ABC transport system permease protein [Agromyces atrinae]RXZ88051.1 ABC transporter permease [Agromyces atrinae]